MQATLERLPQSRVKVKVQLEPSDLRKAEDRALVRLGRGVSIQGFRPGKAPVAVLRVRLDTQRVKNETATQLINLAYQEALSKYDLQVIGLPQVELPALKKDSAKDALGELEEKGFLDVFLTFSVWPEIKLGDYKKIVQEAKEGPRVSVAKTLKEAQAKANQAKESIVRRATEALEKTPQEQKQVRIDMILEALREGIKFELPEVLIEEETRLRLQNSERNAQKMGLSLKDYLAARGDNLEDYQQRIRLMAQQALRTRLILEKIGQDLGKVVEKSEDLEYIMQELLKM